MLISYIKWLWVHYTYSLLLHLFLMVVFIVKVCCNACKKPVKASQYAAHAGQFSNQNSLFWLYSLKCTKTRPFNHICFHKRVLVGTYDKSLFILMFRNSSQMLRSVFQIYNHYRGQNYAVYNVQAFNNLSVP